MIFGGMGGGDDYVLIPSYNRVSMEMTAWGFHFFEGWLRKDIANEKPNKAILPFKFV